MQLVPVLEIRHGKGVHIEPKNRFVDEVVKENVIDIVARWSDKGVKRIHIVDVDAIESGEPENVTLVRKIKTQFPHIQVQVIGGIKCIESAYVWADAGADFLVVNSRVINQKDFLDDLCIEFPNRVMVEIDSNQKKLAASGQDAIEQLLALGKRLEDEGIVGLLITHIGDNGRRDKSSLGILGEFSRSLDIPVYANGGIDNLADLESLLASKVMTPTGVLIGKPLYSENFCLHAANGLLEQHIA
ncbi:1-(5-phosphoribosyl)-5-[(5-phosphoribosylamino)methylideneamino]imidazole-4-carboxamide isomerase [Aliikangiella sp. IMCC44653]